MASKQTWVDTVPASKYRAELADFKEQARYAVSGGHDPINQFVRLFAYSGGDNRFFYWLVYVGEASTRGAVPIWFPDLKYDFKKAYLAGKTPKAALREAVETDTRIGPLFSGEEQADAILVGPLGEMLFMIDRRSEEEKADGTSLVDYVLGQGELDAVDDDEDLLVVELEVEDDAHAEAQA